LLLPTTAWLLLGAEGAAYHDVSTSGTLLRAGAKVGGEATNVGYIVSGEWIRYSGESLLLLVTFSFLISAKVYRIGAIALRLPCLDCVVAHLVLLVVDGSVCA
jgi:hypothetical protein